MGDNERIEIGKQAKVSTYLKIYYYPLDPLAYKIITTTK